MAYINYISQNTRWIFKKVIAACLAIRLTALEQLIVTLCHYNVY